MSGGKPVSVVLIPPYLFRVYLTETGLLPRFHMLLARAREARRTLEGCCDAALEIEGLICAPPPPERLRESLRELLAPLGPDLVLWTPPEDPGSGEAEFFPAGSAAGALDSLRRVWARSWIPGTIRAGRLPDIPGAVEAVPASVLSGRDRPGLAKSLDADLDPESLEKVLDRAEALLSARAPAYPAILEEVRESLVLVRYAAGRAYNQDVRTNDPYQFLVRIDSPDPGDPGRGVLLGLLRRSFELEERLVRAAGSPAASRSGASPLAAGFPSAGKGADGSEAGRAFGPRDRPVEASRVRQVTGSPSSPGRAAGTAVRPGSRPSGEGRVGEAAGRGAADGSPPFVLLCDRLTRDLLAAFPDAAAAAERDGGRVGLGARLARSAGLPCVSGVRDLDRVPEGTRVGVDGDLGIVSLETVR